MTFALLFPLLQMLIPKSSYGCVLIIQLKCHLLLKAFSAHSIQRLALPPQVSVSASSLFPSQHLLKIVTSFCPPSLPSLLPSLSSRNSISYSLFYPLHAGDCCFITDAQKHLLTKRTPEQIFYINIIICHPGKSMQQDDHPVYPVALRPSQHIAKYQFEDDKFGILEENRGSVFIECLLHPRQELRYIPYEHSFNPQKFLQHRRYCPHFIHIKK